MWVINETALKRSARSPRLAVESTMFSMLVSEFTSLEEPTEDVSVAVVMNFLADGHKQLGSKRWMTPCIPTCKLKLPIAEMIP
jgi:hypothetical protein